VQAAAELAVPADGRFLYASNRGQQGGVNNVATFAVDPSDGSLTPVAWEDGGGAVQFPRMISLSAGDGYLLVRRWLHHSWARGCLALADPPCPPPSPLPCPFPHSPLLTVSPLSVQVANQDGDSISAFRRDPDTGLLQLTDTISTAGVVTNPTFVQVVPVGQAPAACSR
jgi:6-phosphogluconolactonase (cycloisomerase 2 family)